MDNFSKIYWITRLDSINNACSVIIFFSLAALVAYFFIYAMESEWWDEEDRALYKKNWKWAKISAIVLLVVSGLTAVFLPNKNEAILIYAGGKAMNFVEQDTSLNRIPAQTTKAVTDYLDRVIKEVEK